MRSAILDVGSNSAHLAVFDLLPGGGITQVVKHKTITRLAEAISPDGMVDPAALERLTAAVNASVRAAHILGVDEFVAFATAAIRDAVNRQHIVESISALTGVSLGFVPAVDEGRFTFLAARAWYGWSAGPLLVADIGGGSLELAVGDGLTPRWAVSLPLGAGRLTRERLTGDPPKRKQVRRLRAHIDRKLERKLTQDGPDLTGVRAIATSQTFRQLARLTADEEEGGWILRRSALRAQVPRLTAMSTSDRARLPGIKRSRARQILAGALVAERVMTHCGIHALQVCPWGLREGIVLTRLACLAQTTGGTDPGPRELTTLAQALATQLPSGPEGIHVVA